MASAVKRGADVAREARLEEAARTPRVPVKTRTEPVEITRSLSEEVLKGYDFLFVGLDLAGMPEGGFNPDILVSARSFGGPLAVAIAGAHKRDPIGGPLRLLVPITDVSARRRGRDRTRARESRRTHHSLPLAGGVSAFIRRGAPAASLNASERGGGDQGSRRVRRSSRSIGARQKQAVGRLARRHSRRSRRSERVVDRARRRCAAERGFAFWRDGQSSLGDEPSLAAIRCELKWRGRGYPAPSCKPWRSASAGVPLTLVFELGGRLELILGGVHGRAPDLVARVISHLHRLRFDGDVMRSHS